MTQNKGFPEIKWEEDDDQDDIFGATAQKKQDTGDFEELLTQTTIETEDLDIGEKVIGTLVATPTPHSQVAIDLGAQSAGVIDGMELCDPETKEPVKKSGDKIEAYVVSRQQDSYVLSLSKSQSLRSFDDLQRAYQDRIPVKGRVEKSIKGGLEVIILGKRAFCPISKIDAKFVSDVSQYLGKDFEFYVETLEAGGRNIVVNRAKLLAEKSEKVFEEFVNKDHSEEEYVGTVTRVEPFGAFVQFLDVLEGMVHISEISHIRISHPSEVLRIGESVRVKVLKVEAQAGPQGRPKIGLSIKAAVQDPWERIYEELKVGESYSGRVSRLMDFGAFVEIKQQYEGLIHISEMSWIKKVRHPKDVLSVGQDVKVQVKAIDSESKRIGLTLKFTEDDPWLKNAESYKVGQEITAEVMRLKGFGAIVEPEPGMSGLVPTSILKAAFGDSYKRKSSPGQSLTLVVENIDTQERKMQFSIPGVEADNEGREDYEEYLKSQKAAEVTETVKTPKSSTPAKGSFGDLLAAQMAKSDK